MNAIIPALPFIFNKLGLGYLVTQYIKERYRVIKTAA